LPEDQFYITFSKTDEFLKDGQICRLIDQTPFLSVPPPSYSLSVGHPKDVRPGNTDDREVQLISHSSLPFRFSLSSIDQNGLKFTFTPNKTSGVPGYITTSNLHISVSPYTIPNSYTIPIHADIILTPSFSLDNPDFTSSIPLKAISNFTITVLPELSFSEKFKAVWDTYGGLLTIIIPLSGGAGAGLYKAASILNKRLKERKAARVNGSNLDPGVG